MMHRLIRRSSTRDTETRDTRAREAVACPDWPGVGGPRTSTRLVWAVSAIAVVLGLWLHPATAVSALGNPGSATQQDSVSAEVIRRLTGPYPDTALAALPDHFPRVFGYRPTVENGVPSNPHGDCSSPIRLPAQFEPFCRTHDFGYDVLRYAARAGRPLGPWARLSLDQMLAERMQRSCRTAPCLGAAELARAGLGLNTWRQHDGPPTTHESGARIVGSVVERLAESVIDSVGGVR